MNIREFQRMMREIYFHHDSNRGVERTLKWLESEVSELRGAIERGVVREVEEEFADVFAWLCSLANLLKVDLEDACLKRYPNKCPKCMNNPCKCDFRIEPEG